jgi:aryl-alcohol dehydrogenase-like predicted oxidoreductase
LETAKNNGIEVHARSLFLQGLLLDKEVTLPATIVKFAPELLKYFEFCETLSLSPLEMALAYVIKNDFIDYGVVGCVSEKQITNIISSYKKVSSLDLDFNFDSVISSSEVLVNPSLWK